MFIEIKDETYLDLIVGDNRKLFDNIVRIKREADIDLQDLLATGICLGLAVIKANDEERRAIMEITDAISARVKEEEKEAMGAD